jgi:outer membrane protein assembly factor BamB
MFRHFSLARTALFTLVISGTPGFSVVADAASKARVCAPEQIGTPAMFRCDTYTSLPATALVSTLADSSEARRAGAATASDPAAQFFPQSWTQLGFNQRHNPVFSVPATAPDYLTRGTFWAAPLTGMDFLDVGRAFRPESAEEWGSTTSQYLGNVVGASVARGVVFVQNGRRDIWAISAQTGKPLWRNIVTTSAGMGQAVVDEVGGKLMVFAPVGDAAYTVQNAIEFANGKTHFRGANFAGIYAYDGLTGAEIWRFETRGSARPTPVLRDGKLYVTTNNNQFFVLDAASGTQLGSFTNPGNGASGLAAANWFDTADGRRLIIYGTIRPPRIFAIDVTNPAAPVLAWSHTPVAATANAPGDTSAAIDPELGLLYTTVFVNKGTEDAPIFDLNMVALNATTGALVWSHFMGEGDSPPGYKGSIPMVHAGVVYAGNTSDGTFQAFDAATGTRLWVADLAESPGPIAQLTHRPRAAPVFYDGKLILAEGRDIHTFDPATGTELNRFEVPGVFGVWGINQPVIVGKLFILSSISGWVFAAPVDFITGDPGYAGPPVPPGLVPVPRRPPEYLNLLALPKINEAWRFPATWLSYTAGQDHNSVVSGSPGGVAWQTPLTDAVPLDAPPRDEALYGSEVASHMMHQFVGVGSGVSVARGIAYVGSDRFTVHALNASTGRPIWRARTQNANFGQPIVTPKTVVVGGGDPWLNQGGTGAFRRRMPPPSPRIGDNWGYLRGLSPLTGFEKWTVYSGLGSSSTTPLYHNGNLYWVNGEGSVWAVNADTGQPVAPFMAMTGLPVLSLGGFNAISSANIYRQAGADIMVVGMSMPNRMVGINLATATVAWTQDLASIGTTYLTGFATVPPAVSQAKGLVVGTVLGNADVANNTVTQWAFALNAATGAEVWTEAIASGPIPVGGFVGPTPLLDSGKAYMNDPLGNDVVALNLLTGDVQWRASVDTLPGRFSWGPGVLVKGKLIQPVGPQLYTLDAATGAELNQYTLGGSMTYNHPTVVGKTLYIGNSWGWVTALPLATVTGDAAD